MKEKDSQKKKKKKRKKERKKEKKERPRIDRVIEIRECYDSKKKEGGVR